MKAAILERTSGWMPTVLVLVVVLLAGSRLIVLSLERHAEEARAAAASVLARDRQAIESQLIGLARLASEQAARAARAIASGNARRLGSLAPGRNTFWIGTDGTVVRSSNSSAALTSGIASEWATADARRGATAEAEFLGPVRQGSEWIVASRAPVVVPPAGGAPQRAGWSVAYADLERLLANARLGRLVDAGYDFALSQPEPATRSSRVFVSAGAVPANDSATITIRTPPGFASSVPSGYLELAIRPREGWYPAGKLASEIGLLALLAWLLAFGTHDLVHRSRRLQAALADSKRRLQSVSERLMTEVEERQNLQKTFDHARYHDAFTGLPNRRFFMDQLDRALREVRARRRQGIAVALIDIERFKLINETLGHTAGDELMVQAARRFEKAVGSMESVLARWGGDQFALLLFDVASNEAALGVAAALQEELRAPFELRRHRLTVAARMGVTCTDSGPQRADDVVREADIALSVAKKPASPKTMAYAPAMGGHAVSLVSLEADLHLALERNELRLLFQPIVDLRSRQAVGAEALLRWHHPVEGLLRPDRFLAIAEEAGLMVPITRWIIFRVCRLAGEWRLRLPPGSNFYLSINLSAAALRDPGLSACVASALEQAHVAPGSLKFELTESGLISNVGAAREALHRLHDMGIQLMLDDFGTGYSSLNYLQLFPFDYVKIDRPFVNRVGTNGANSGIMSAMVQIASSLGLKTIAEIIETQAAAYTLQKMGCDFGQGNFFGPPVEAEEALQRLRGRDWAPPAANAADGRPDDSPTLVLPVISR